MMTPITLGNVLGIILTGVMAYKFNKLRQEAKINAKLKEIAKEAKNEKEFYKMIDELDDDCKAVIFRF